MWVELFFHHKTFFMGIASRLRHTSSLNQPSWLVVLRVALGAMLFIKGIAFISDSSRLEAILASSRLSSSFNPVFADLIAWTHLIGGLFILTGLLTRLMTLVQIPILVGAVFFVNLPNLTINSSSELALSIIMLVLLIVFFVEGSGRFSADEYFRTYYKAGTENNLKI